MQVPSDPLALGGDGLVSVVSNVVPKLMTQLVKLGRDGKIEEARELLTKGQRPVLHALLDRLGLGLGFG